MVTGILGVVMLRMAGKARVSVLRHGSISGNTAMRFLRNFSVISLLLLAACSPVRSGTIVAKWYEPPVDEWRYEYTCDPLGVGGTQQCDFKGHWVHEDERFMIMLQSCELDTENCHKSSWSIDELDWNRLEIGDWYDV